MIKKIIHYVWFGKKELPEEFKKNLASWKKYCPDYEIMCWNEDNFDINMCNYTKQTYESKKFAYLSDFVRIWALKNYGGIYLDTDVEILKPIDELLDCEGFIGFENKYWLGTSVIAGQGKWLDDVLQLYMKSDFIVSGKMMMVTSPIIFTKVLEKHGLKQNGTMQHLKDGVNIYPEDYFSPKNFWTGEIKVTENSYFIHHYAATWFGKLDKFANKLGHGLKAIIGNKAYTKLIERASLSDGRRKMKIFKKSLRKKEKRTK